MKPINVQSLATEMDHAIYYDESSERFHLRDGSPDWMFDIIHSSSGDWQTLYKFANRIASAFADNDDPEDAITEIEPDIYTSDLIAWLARDVKHVFYMTEVLEEGDVKDGFSLLMEAQSRHIQEVAWDMLHALNDLVDKLKSERESALLNGAYVRVNGVPYPVIDYNINDDEILVEFPDEDNEFENDSEWMLPEDVILHDPEADYWPECDDNEYETPPLMMAKR